jgi:putative peptidoglycan lipid II flippase
MSSVRKNASIATIAVSFSRVAGLVREMVFAFFFGAGPALDAFIAAFRIPNLLRDLFSEGALSTSFVTVFAQQEKKEGEKSAWDLASQTLNFVIVFVGVLTLLGIIFSPWIVKIIASGFEGDKFQYTVFLNRILFPFILFISMAAVCMGILNTKGKFALPQSASTFFNLTSIIVGLFFAYCFAPDLIKASFEALLHHAKPQSPSWLEVTKAMTGMALGTLLGGFVQWAVQMPALYKLGFRYRFSLNLRHPGLMQVLKLTIPAVIGGAAVQVNVMVNTNFASYLADGSISWLNYAFRLMQFPLGVFGVAVAAATAPAVARFAIQNDSENLKTTVSESVLLTLFLCVPSALGLMALAEPIMALIYQHGRFNAFDTHQAALALRAYAVGLVFYSLIKVLQPVFLAHGDAKTPMRISIISIVVNFAVNWLLVFEFHFTHWGLALGTSCVACWNGIWLAILLRKKMGEFWDGKIFVEVAKIAGSSFLSVLVGWFCYQGVLLKMDGSGLIAKFSHVFLPIGVTAILYYVLCVWLKVKEVLLFQEWISKRRKI